MKKFKLYSNCIPIKGAKCSLLYDLQRNTYTNIPNDLYEILETYEGQDIESVKDDYHPNTHSTINEYIEFLLKNEYIFFTDHPDYFPKLDLKWDFPTSITNSIIDFDKDSLHLKSINNIVKQLDDLLCWAIEFRFFSTFSNEIIKEVLDSTKKSGIRCIQLVICDSETVDDNFIEDLFKRNNRLSQILIHSYSQIKQLNNIIKYPVFTSREVIDHTKCGHIFKFNFTFNIPFFSESLNFNNCLHRKVSIDSGGKIKNCPSMKIDYGNISNKEISEILGQKEFRKYWEIKKDDIKTCKDCEFRYSCTDCRAYISDEMDIYSKPAKCNYNPYTAKWE